MKKRRITKGILILTSLLVGYCAIPFTSVAIVTLSVSNQTGQPVMGNVSARFLDENGAEIAVTTLASPGSWNNNLHWWTHSAQGFSTHTPADVRRAREAEIAADGCTSVTIPVNLSRSYEAPSLAPHGGGSAYMMYEMKQSVELSCVRPDG